MPKRIYVGNLPSRASAADVRKMFSEFGPVNSVSMDKSGGAYVEMSRGADEAIQSLHQTEMGGRSLKVSASRR